MRLKFIRKGLKNLAIKYRLPSLVQVYPVYAIIVILVYGWTIYWALWKLPSWLDFLTLGEIGAIFSYLLATNFIESLFVLFGVVLVCLILPQRWFREVFVSRGSIFAACILISIMVFEYHFDKPSDYLYKFPLYLPWILLLAVVLTFLAGWIRIVRKSVEAFAENAVIFLFILIPISLLSLIMVIARNLI
jgi:hypothetical protein